MREVGNIPKGVEVGNAWANRCPDIPQTNWIIGMFPTIPTESLRYMPQSDLKGDLDNGSAGIAVTDLCVKWFIHQPDDPLEWGMNKPLSTGCTMAMLTNEGEFEITFFTKDQPYIVTFTKPGDFAVWGAGLGHSWRPLKMSSTLTVRWKPKDLR
ncbi:MAG: hypothetical protein AAFY33_14055 [Cyanobacteria bacterium J06643_4]